MEQTKKQLETRLYQLNNDHRRKMDEYRQTRYLLGNSPENGVKPTKSGEQLEIEAKLFRMQMDDEQAARWVPGTSPYQSKEERIKTMSILPEPWRKFNNWSNDDRSHFFMNMVMWLPRLHLMAEKLKQWKPIPTTMLCCSMKQICGLAR